MDKNTQLTKLDKKIEKIKGELLAIGEMRPGKVSKQYNVCGTPNCKCKDKNNPQKHGPYYQLSYVHKGKNSSQFIRKEFLKDVEKQTANYKKFKTLTDEWITLALERAKLSLEIAKEQR